MSSGLRATVGPIAGLTNPLGRLQLPQPSPSQGETNRSESVAGMDMLNDMYQRQARRLESQLYQRAQDLRTIEQTQRSSAMARSTVKQLESQHQSQSTRLSQGSKSLQRLQDVIQESIASSQAALALCEALELDANELRQQLARAAPDARPQLSPQVDDCRQFFEGQRAKLASIEATLSEADRSAQQQMGLLPLSPSRVVPAGAQPMAVS